MSDQRLIVGLGNPGLQYQKTRHNLGFMVVNRLAQRFRCKWQRSQACHGKVAADAKHRPDFCLLFPLTYMNHSGEAVRDFAQAQDLVPENILVVCDDWNLEFGQIRVRSRGRDGGHHGLASVIKEIGTASFPRLRCGIGAPPEEHSATEYVLGGFTRTEEKSLGPFIDEAADCCEAWLNKSMSEVMSQYNQRTNDE